MSGDRRSRRRAETIQEILDVSVGIMEAEGVAGLSLSEIARRMGIRPPSLYQYFPSKMAIYDALFELGTRQLVEVLERHQASLAEDPLRAIGSAQDEFFAWLLAHPVLAQLMYWRPVPGFQPSPEAYAPAVRQLDLLRDALRAAVAAGQLAPEAAGDEGVALYTVLTTGVISQQLSNEPSPQSGRGRFVALGPAVLEMFCQRYAPTKGAPDDRLVRPRRGPAPPHA